MRALVQRVLEAKVEIAGQTVGAINRGYLIFLGVGHEDDAATGKRLWDKINKLRIFEDENGKTNLNLAAVNGEVLIVSQFTLWADTKHGNRPGFTNSAKPEPARELYLQFVENAKQDVQKVATGEFGADMQVHLINDGPFTLWLDTDDWK